MSSDSSSIDEATVVVVGGSPIEGVLREKKMKIGSVHMSLHRGGHRVDAQVVQDPKFRWIHQHDRQADSGS